MDSKERYGDHVAETEEEIIELRKGQWTSEEDLKLIDCVSIHGPGRWRFLARSAGLNRNGRSCRLRWLNYLRPDVKRGNMTLEEQILILELHSRWGNRWSNIARELPGRTDNEIKNYYRTRVQKLAKLLNCDVKSLQFRDAISHLWLPIMRERLQAASTKSSVVQQQPTSNTPPHHNIASNTTGYGLLEVESNCTKSETPEEAGRVSAANSHLIYGAGDNVLGSDWWGSLQDEAGLITDVMSTAFSVGYYSEQEKGYEGGILEEWGGGWLGGGDSIENLILFNHDI